MPASARHKRREQPAAVLLLICVLALLGLLLLQPMMRSAPAEPEEPGHRALVPHDMVEFDRFSARRERSTAGGRLSLSLRLRTALADGIDCYVFVVARNDQASTRAWSIWPPQPPGLAITVGGHFHGAVPATGHRLRLSDQWERVTAAVPLPNGGENFNTVVVYVLHPDGRILLARPFRI